MGGLGSGRDESTAKLDEGLRLDINKLVREGLIPRRNIHQFGTLTWTSKRTGEKTASLGFETNTTDSDDMWIRLYYTVTIQDEKHDVDYKIRLTTTQPHYGGKRFWFLCPSTNRRTSVLYSPPGSRYFKSRHAYNLKYSSQSKGPYDRANDKAWKLKNRLGGENYYRRPKGMHRTTHERLTIKLWQAEAEADQYFSEMVMSRFGNL